MHKLLIAVGLLASVALLSGTPAKAEVGCGCGKIGAPPVCTATVSDCLKSGGLCLFPCDYQAPKKMMDKKSMGHAKKKKKM